MMGTPSPAKRDARFWARVDKSETCWNWTGSRTIKGYGQVHINRRGIYAHRRAYELLVGPIARGLELDHLCHNPSCVRPDHLRAVTHAENMRNLPPGVGNAAKARCPKGHEYTPENTYAYRGRRSCRACHLAASRAYRGRHRQE